VATLFVASGPLQFFSGQRQGFWTGLWAWKWSVLPSTVAAVVLGMMLARRFLPGWSGLDAAE
jgi:hypothetical protein